MLTAVFQSPPAARGLLFERLLAELSAGFVNLPASSVDEAITDALRRIGRSPRHRAMQPRPILGG
jgi:hypothetical protein